MATTAAGSKAVQKLLFALDPRRLGTSKFVESVNFKDSDVLAQSAAQDEETSETAPDAVDFRKKVTKPKR